MPLFGRDIAELLAPQGARRQHLPGFDEGYADIVDYILRCTHRIWEQKDIGLIETHYAPDCRIHTMIGIITGIEAVVAGTLRTLAAFPDRTLIGDAVIWSDEGEGVFLSSHRIRSQGLNLGPSEFGPATGRRASFTTIADCLCARNLIVEEWLVRDNSALVLDLGLDPRAVAQVQAGEDLRRGSPATWRREAMERVRATAVPARDERVLPDPQREAASFAHALVAQLWNRRRLDLVRAAYSPAVQWRGPGARRLFGHGEVTGWIAALLACFGDARLAVEHVAAIDAGEGAQDIALRWTLAGTHDGSGIYGPATGRPVYILGVTHWRVRAGLIEQEDTIFDEIALLRQLEGGL